MTRGQGLWGPLTAVAIAVAVIALACAGWFGSAWYRAEHSATLAAARVRDQALREGEQAIQNFNTLDYRRVRQGVSLWEESSTGPLLREISAGSAAFEQEVRKARTITSATILDGALTTLNPRAGTADIIAAVQITVKPPTGSATTKQARLKGTLRRTAVGWKLSGLGQVPVGASG